MDRDHALSLPRASEFNAYVNAALDRREIGKDEWYELNDAYFTRLYLSTDDPRAQSGHGGDERHYAFSHLPIVEALYKDGTFLDVGCANGHLGEMVHKWAAAVGFDLRMYGVDISRGLIALAQTRLPHWREQFYVGNSFYWKPEQKYDYIHIGGLGQVPPEDERAFFDHLMENYVIDGGRLILGPAWYDGADARHDGIRRLLDSGVSPSGYVEKTHYNNPSRLRRAVWFDKRS